MPYNRKLHQRGKLVPSDLNSLCLKIIIAFQDMSFLIMNACQPLNTIDLGCFMIEVMQSYKISFVGHSLRSVNGNTVYSHNQIILNSVLILACPYSQFEDKHLNDS